MSPSEPVPPDEADVVVRDEPAEHRYVVLLGGRRVGLLDYHDRGENRALLHTEVDAAYEGRGFAGRLARAALDDVRTSGRSVLPFCPYVREFIARHPDYVDLVPVAQRARFGLER
jgi:predicted GNAT family acetyltransferase